jgi:hypothetical protein
LFPANELHTLSSLCLDHAPLLLQTDASYTGKGRFQFKAFWPKCTGFLEVIKRAWHCPLQGANPFRRLDWLLQNTAWFLKSWDDRFVGNVWPQLEIAKEVVSHLESARDCRSLASYEESLRQKFKLKRLALSSPQRTIARQESRLLWLREGDTPTKFFHAHANAQRRRNFISSLEHEGQVLVAEHGKARAWYDFFDDVLGSLAVRTSGVLLEALGLPYLDLQQQLYALPVNVEAGTLFHYLIKIWTFSSWVFGSPKRRFGQ